MIDERDVQRKYIQLQLFKQQLTTLIEQKNIINERISELTISIDALKKLGNVKKDQRIMTTLGSSVFVSANIQDSDNVLVNIGAGVMALKGRHDAIILLKQTILILLRVILQMVLLGLLMGYMV